MIKQRLLKKRILVDAAMLGGFLVFLGVLAFIASSVYESLSGDRSKLQSATMALQSENNTIREQINKADQSLELYTEIVRFTRNRDININRESARGKFQELVARYGLKPTGNNSFGQIRDVTTQGAEKKTGTLVISDAEFNLEGVTDELFFRFLNDLHRELGGFVVLNTLNITKNSDITAQTYKDLGQGSFPSLATMTVRFLWIGIKPKPAEQDATATGGSPAAVPPAGGGL